MIEWRYVRQGRVRHALEGPHIGSRAVCGFEVWTSPDWYGTGSQVEYETVQQLPDCRRCRAILDRPMR